jgi:Fe2+ transport system protein FeoA
MLLSDMNTGETATIVGVFENHDYTTRLKSFGFVLGAKLIVLRSNSKAMHIRIGTSEWAIRRSSAELVEVA